MRSGTKFACLKKFQQFHDGKPTFGLFVKQSDFVIDSFTRPTCHGISVGRFIIDEYASLIEARCQFPDDLPRLGWDVV